MSHSDNFVIESYMSKVVLPEHNSHKGQNGKLLLIGGSDLFHAASKWSLDIASKFVDMLFYASVPSNNQLVQVAKGEFWNGIVISRTDIDAYADEADCILIGPGMTRENTGGDWLDSTEKVTNHFLAKYPNKKWVIDAGALQMVDPTLINSNVIITPHSNELHRLMVKNSQLKNKEITEDKQQMSKLLSEVSTTFGNCTIVYKGETDIVVQGSTVVPISGGHPGMTKGGTGDVLSGLIAGLYSNNDQLTSAVVGSYINKKAGEQLSQTVGPFFNASDLVQSIPTVLWQQISHKV